MFAHPRGENTEGAMTRIFRVLPSDAHFYVNLT